MNIYFPTYKSLIVGTILFAVTIFAYATLNCKVDNTPIMFTGESKLGNNGTLVWEHKCLMGHTYWFQSVVN